ncbi:Nuclear control of ATPase protein 2 [Polyrhizophydium stewartii]|uniref:Nuclear control of ATPase protein 2 n=1 Tax=Polyrhizophydium stewartii TaxID=2732419 RepID=A0ABR4NJP5_9FUNG
MSFVGEQLRATLDCIDGAFRIRTPDTQTLQVLFAADGAPAGPQPGASAAAAEAAGDARAGDTQALWDALTSPLFDRLAAAPASSTAAALARAAATAPAPDARPALGAAAAHGVSLSLRARTLRANVGDIRRLLAGAAPSAHTLAALAAGVPAARHELGHLVLLCKALAAIRALALNEILGDVQPFTREIAYWEVREASQRSAAMYVLQMLPDRLDRIVCAALLGALTWTGIVRILPASLVRLLERSLPAALPAPDPDLDAAAVAAAASTESLASDASHDGSVTPTASSLGTFGQLGASLGASLGSLPQLGLGLGLALKLRPMSILDAARAEMAFKRGRLMHAQLWQAQCLGLLARSNAESVFRPVTDIVFADPPPPAANATAAAAAAAPGSASAFNLREASRKIGRLFRPVQPVGRHRHHHARRGQPLQDQPARRSWFGDSAAAVAAESQPPVEPPPSALMAETKEILRNNIANEIASIGAVVNSLSRMSLEIGSIDSIQPLAIEPPTPGARTSSVSDLYAQVQALAASLQKMSTQSDEIVARYGRPSFALRAWVPATIAVVMVVVVSRMATPQEIVELAYNAGSQVVETARDFVRNWILRPLENMLKTIRHDEARLALLGTESLSSDLDSLERMVVDFARDHSAVGADALKTLGDRARLGDLTVVLQRYEAEIKKPIRGVVTGELIRSLLIQIQKAKVDGELAISALDKLLKSNELNFAFLAVMPALAVTYTAVGWAARALAPRPVADSELVHAMKSSLRDIERIFNRMDLGPHGASQESILVGLLLCEIAGLRASAAALPELAADKPRLAQDIRDLENIAVFRIERTAAAGIAVLERMWRTHAIFGH